MTRKEILGVFMVADAIKPEAVEAVKAFISSAYKW